jgi:hypothetical protein
MNSDDFSSSVKQLIVVMETRFLCGSDCILKYLDELRLQRLNHQDGAPCRNAIDMAFLGSNFDLKTR